MPTLEFGVKTGQGGYLFEELVKVWSASEELGYDSIWLYDHFHALGNVNDPCLEAWTTLSALAALTKRAKIGTMTTCVSYRMPSLLAKMGATVDVISHGRLVLGIGAGWYKDEYSAYGYEFTNDRVRVRALKEALIIINQMWTADRSTFEGEFYSVHDAVCLPKPVQKPRPQILVGISKGRRTMPYLASRYADGFNTPNSSVDDCKGILEAAEEYWKKSGKPMDKQTKSWQGFVLIGESSSEVENMIGRVAKSRGQSATEFQKSATERGFIMGQPDEVVERIRQFKEIGFNNFLMVFSEDTSIRPREIFRDKVIPRLR
jgi:alkanesulfonate monooxygenase SsuD/methylene tetrahydromethanopterin reductase-like flavin-dependent oxidoreductase (luciferase family)